MSSRNRPDAAAPEWARRERARQWHRQLYPALAALFTVLVFAGFARSYYLRIFFEQPPLPSTLVQVHGLVMTAWVALFVVQVGLVSSRHVRVHQRLGYAGIGLAVLVVVVGVWTALEAARHGSASTPPGASQPTFSIVPLGDLVLFMLFFGGAVYFRKTPRRHRGLMFLTAVNFLPPAAGRLAPILGITNSAPLAAGIPVALAIASVVVDARRHRHMDRLLLSAVVIFVLSFPLRIALMTTPAWARASAWLASLVS